jgi:hypothetical protein
MPKKLERKLIRQGKKKHLSGDQLDAYVYDTMRDTGWKPEQEKKKEVYKP